MSHLPSLIVNAKGFLLQVYEEMKGIATRSYIKGHAVNGSVVPDGLKSRKTTKASCWRRINTREIHNFIEQSHLLQFAYGSVESGTPYWLLCCFQNTNTLVYPEILLALFSDCIAV